MRHTGQKTQGRAVFWSDAWASSFGLGHLKANKSHGLNTMEVSGVGRGLVVIFPPPF